MKDIMFVTSNEKKVISAQRYLNSANLIFYEYDLIEPRSESLKEIAKHKVLQAYDLVKSDCIVLDSGFYIEALNGWPGTFINFNLKKLGLEGIMNLLRDNPNRSAYYKDCLAYYDGKDIQYFYGLSKGTLASYISGINDPNDWSNLRKIFIPYNCDKPMAEMTEEEKNNRPDGHTSPFKELNEFVRKLERK